MMLLACALSLALSLALNSFLPAPAVAPLAAGSQAVAESLEELLRELELAPDDPERLDAVSRAAVEAEAMDEGLFYARAALRALGPEPKDKSLAKALSARVAELDPAAEEVQAALDAYADQVFRLGQAAMKRKLWANAVDLFLACEGTSFEARADKQLAKIYGNEKAGEALIASGIDVPVLSKDRKSPDAIRRLDEKHSTFEKAYEAKNDLYTIKSDMGYEFTEAVLKAMTQANWYLRLMYQHKIRGQSMRRCVIEVYSEWEDFADAHDLREEPNVLGFFMPNDNMIATFDQTSRGRSFGEVWETLFHEGSHQFADDVSKLQLPTWIDEGVACYFEGTRLMPNGTVVDNLVPDSRLKNLVKMMGGLPDEGATASRPSPADIEMGRDPEQGDDPIDLTQEFFAHIISGSYGGEWYPWGWGFVYFMRNYEDENGERFYLPHFNAFVESYKGGGQHDVWERWVEYFITNPEKPGIDTFEDFYAMWAAWIFDLHRVHFGGPDRADDLLERGLRQVENGKPEYAVESFTWALGKRGGDPQAMYRLALVNTDLEEDDIAVYYLRKTLEWTTSQPDPEADVEGLEMTVAELGADCFERIGAIYEPLVEGVGDAQEVFQAEIVRLAGAYQEAELPRSAAQLYEDATALLGRRHELLDARNEIADEGDFDLRQPRRLTIDEDLSSWLSTNDEAFEGAGADLVSTGEPGLAYVEYAVVMPASFRLEATITFDGEAQGGGLGVLGVQLGAGSGPSEMIALLTSGNLVTVKVDRETRNPSVDKLLEGGMDIGPGASFEFAVEVDGDVAEYFIDGESVGAELYGSGDLRGRIGFFAQGQAGGFSNLRVLY